MNRKVFKLSTSQTKASEKRWPERVTAIAAAVGLVLTAIGLVFTGYQSYMTRQQLELQYKQFKNELDAERAASIERDSDRTRSMRYSDAVLSQSEKSLQAQINSLVETRRQFEVDNMPYIEIRDFEIIDIDEGMTPKVFYTIVNNGKQSAYVSTGRFVLLFTDESVDTVLEQARRIAPPVTNIHRYISKEVLPERTLYLAESQVPYGVRFQLNYVGRKAYFYGRVDYRNEVNGRKRVYEFLVAIRESPVDGKLNLTKMLFNTNKDVS